MSTTVTIGYADGKPLETAAEVDLLADGVVVATAKPDKAGKLIFAVNVAAKSKLAVRLHSPVTPAAKRGAAPRRRTPRVR